MKMFFHSSTRKLHTTPDTPILEDGDNKHIGVTSDNDPDTFDLNHIQ